MLNASPKRSGCVSRALESFESSLPCEIEREILFLADYDFRPCMGCMKCRTSLSCAFAGDEADAIGEKIKGADVLVVASPTYWANMPGTLKNIFDRNVFRFMGETKAGFPVPLMRGKYGIVITACSTPFPFNALAGQSGGLVRSIREIFGAGGIRFLGAVVCAGTKKSPAPTDAALARTRSLALSLRRLK